MAERRPDIRLVPNPATAPEDGARAKPDDGQLLAAVRAGTAGTAGRLYDRLRPVVDRTICRLLGPSDQDHQDIAQLALIELVRSIDRYRGDCPLDAWTATLTAHVVYKHIRHRQVERRTMAAVSPTPMLEAPHTAPGPARETLMRGLLARVTTHLESMDTRRAWAVALHDVHGHDLKEVAAIMGSTVAAAQTRLSRGRRELHDRIAADPELAGALERVGGGDW